MENIILQQIDSAIYILKINRPSVLNALDKATLSELLAFLQHPPLDCKAIILTGDGEKSFIAGADIKEMNQMKTMKEFCLLGQTVADLLENGPFITVAAVNGYALGGGLEMALACDFIYANPQASFALPEVKLGLIPGFGGTQRLGTRIGFSLAKELIMTGRKMSAQEALEYHLINKISSKETLLDEVVAAIRVILGHSFEAVIQAKQAVNESYFLAMQQGMKQERERCEICFASAERKTAMNSFLGKTQ